MKLCTKNLKLPTKTIKINVLNQELEFEIYPISGFGLIKLQQMAEKLSKDEKNTDLQIQLVKFALKYGAKADDEDINFLVENDLIACMDILNQIMQFANDFNSQKKTQYVKAKKKLEK